MNNRILLALSVTLLACFSAGGAQADDAPDARIDKAEQLLLGKRAVDQPIEGRLDAVEMSLYGKTKHGSVSKRMDAISDFLGIKDDRSVNAEPGKEGKSELGTGESVAKGASDSQPSLSSKGEPGPEAKANTDVKAGSDITPGVDVKAGSDSTTGADVKAHSDVKTGSEVKIGAGLKAVSDSKVMPEKTGSLLKSGSQLQTSSGVKKNVPVSLKSEEAKMAVAAPSGSTTTSATSPASKRQDAMPPQAPSIATTIARTGTARDLLREGMRQFSNGQYDDAEDTFRRVLTVDPRNADAFYNLGSLAERRHDYVIALTNYRAALNFNAKDKDYIAAVTAMEHQLSASSASSASASASRSADHATKTATVGHFKVPVDAATLNPPLDAAGQPINGGANGQPFQLSGTKNDVMMNTTQYTNNYAPTMSVNQGFNPMMSVNQNSAPFMTVNQPGPPPNMGVAQQPPKNGGGFGKVLNVGMRAALYSSGLHCPICRMMGGGFHF
jgi:Flp pilus assembly protein TadD